MATTSLWHISGSLKTVTDYVENPEKTYPELQDLWDVSRYAERPAATADGHYVTAINCLKETALEQMILTKQQYGKTDGYIAYHGYQSFKPGELTAQKCHDIGVELAKAMWGDRFQVLVTTHLDKEHLHNHFVINSVSFIDGKKYNYSKAEMQRLRDMSDELCCAYGLSFILRPRKAPSRPVYLDEKDGKPTRYNVYFNDVLDAIEFNRSPVYVENYLKELGYLTDFTGAHWKIRLPQYEHFTRLNTLDERLTPEFIRQHCGSRAPFGNRHAEVAHSPHMPEELVDAWQPYRRTSRIYRLYLHYCYELGILPKKSGYKPTSPFLKEDLRKLDQIDKETRFLGASGIETLEELREEIGKTQKEMDGLIDRRQHITYAMRRATPERCLELHEDKEELTNQIKKLRERLKTMQAIEKRSLEIDATLTRVYESEERFAEIQQERKSKSKNNERKYER
jgi:hypothetical protein